MSTTLHLEVGPSQSETTDDALRRIEAALEDFDGQEHCPADLVFKLHLILEEMTLNALTYGGAEVVEVDISADSEAVTVVVSDDGSAFDPLNDAPTADVDAALEDRPIGGLGIHLVRTLTNELSYRREGGRNHLTMVTRRDE